MARGTRLGLSLFTGLLLLAPLGAIWLFFQFERACGVTTSGVGRYCSAMQTWDWLRFEGGWWKMSLLAAVVAFAVWARSSEEVAASEDHDAKDPDRPG